MNEASRNFAITVAQAPPVRSPKPCFSRHTWFDPDDLELPTVGMSECPSELAHSFRVAREP
jgi:hypothetical protein